jgi:uncharacterized membrane protein
MIGIPEIVVILLMGLLGLVPLVIVVWLIVRIVQIGTQQQNLEQRIQALERAGQQNR